jgi:hypothetical protein
MPLSKARVRWGEAHIQAGRGGGGAGGSGPCLKHGRRGWQEHCQRPGGLGASQARALSKGIL